MAKDKIIFVDSDELLIVKGNNANTVIGVEMVNTNLFFSIYRDVSVMQCEFKQSSSIKNKSVRIVEFDDKIYLRIKKDTNSNIPICIKEDGDTLKIIDLREIYYLHIAKDILGNLKSVTKNFEIVEGRPFLMEDEFSL